MQNDVKIAELEKRLALLDLVPVESWEFLAEHARELLSTLKVLLENRGSSEPPEPPIEFGRGAPEIEPNGPRVYFERYDDGPPIIWFHTGVKGAEWERASALGRLA